MGNGDNAAHEYSMHTMFSLVATPYLPTLNTGNDYGATSPCSLIMVPHIIKVVFSLVTTPYLLNKGGYVGGVCGKAHSKYQGSWLPNEFGSQRLQLLMNIESTCRHYKIHASIRTPSQ